MADVVIKVKGKDYIIEVAVTHFVDESKREKLKKIGLSAFEIDLSALIKKDISWHELTEAVLSDETNRKWIFNQKKEKLLTKTKADYQKKLDDVAREQENEAKRKQEQQQIHFKSMQEMMEPEKYAKELNRLRNDKQADGWVKYFKFSEKLNGYPFYMDIPITGEFVFSCDRRMWQGLLFDEYVYKGFGQKTCTFTVSNIKNWMFNRKGQIKYDKTKVCATSVFINGQEQEVSFSYDVVCRYFEYLELLGFVYHKGGQWYSERPISLDPPDQSVANILKDILNSVDCSLPNINQVIESELLLRLNEDEKSPVFEWYERKKRPPGYYNIPD